MRILVIGANGLLGSNIVATAQSQGLEVVGTYHSTEPSFDLRLEQLDIRETDAVYSLLDDVRPDVVLNCAALTDVDGCESQPDDAHSINAEAPGEIAQLCHKYDARLVHTSTDYVFDGESQGPYREADAPNPVQVYGKSKLAGERAVRDVSTDALIVRLSFVWGLHRSSEELTGFPAWVRGRLASGESMPLFTDQRVTPSRAGQIASTIFDLLAAEATGIVHAASRSCVTPYEFGDLIRRQMDAPPDLLDEGSMSDVDRAATRPENTCLSVQHLEEISGQAQPTLEEDLQAAESVFDRS